MFYSSSTSSEDEDDGDDDYGAAAASAVAAPTPRDLIVEGLRNLANDQPKITRKIGAVKWATEDAYNLEAFDQVEEGAWPIGHPLPLPIWASQDKPTFAVDTVWQYEDLVGITETILHHLLEETHYDTVHNYMDFYSAFRKTGMKSLRKFLRKYTPPVNRRHHMCVSLAMEIVARLTEVMPELGDHLYIVSCEESVESIQTYIETSTKTVGGKKYSSEKEHALLVMKVRVAGRDGFMVLDPGYHVARAVTVMHDQCYPHTGWFTQSEDANCKREYSYELSAFSPAFIEWSEKTSRATTGQTQEKSLVYVERQYRTAIDVTVRRNLVYNFRSLLSRTAKGRVQAGIYFPVVSNAVDAHLTLFYDSMDGNEQVKIKQKFSAFREKEVSL